MIFKKNFFLDKLIKQDNLDFLLKYKVGLEREALRVDENGNISDKPHPIKLGSTLTHKNITTDFSESQLELVSDPETSIEKLIINFKYLHKFVQDNIDNEILWANSMPCIINKNIDIARYGESNIGKFKELYRTGLANRYGRNMQLISGIHFNFSFEKIARDHFESILYPNNKKNSSLEMHMSRNLLRLIPFSTFFFGNSNSFDKSFINKTHKSIKYHQDSRIGEESLSIRMGDLGYVNSSRCHVNLRLDSLDTLIEDYTKALTKECIEYKLLGTENSQINSNILQIEAEYYNIIRPKSNTHKYGRLLKALKNDGVTYIEHRGIDIDESEIGISDWKLYILHLLFIYSLTIESPKITKSELREINKNQRIIAMNGANPNIKIAHQFIKINFLDISKKLIEDLSEIAIYLDSISDSNHYTKSITMANNQLLNKNIYLKDKISKIEKTSFNEYALELSKEVNKNISKIKIDKKIRDHYSQMSKESIIKYKNIGVDNKIDFAEYLKIYNQEIKNDN